MQLTESFLKDYVLERCFVKPQIRLNNYLLKWEETSYGIPQKEVSELKAFLKEILPYISEAFFKAAGQISKTIEQEVGDGKQVRKIHDSFVPQLLISYRKVGYGYVLQMREDGVTIIKRNETVTASKVSSSDNSNNNKNTPNAPRRGKNPALSIDFILGELVFVR